jgi:citrate lyase subunit beta/citryl-CoA lyase
VSAFAAPLWRSLLFVPANVERFVRAAHERGADAVQLDLEDSIAPSEKDAARRAVGPAAESLAARGCEVVVRINRPLRLALADIDAAVAPCVRALTLPKVESADHLRMLCEAIGEAEARRGMIPGSTRTIALIETPRAVLEMAQIAAADPRVAAIILGGEDLATALGVASDSELFVQLASGLVVAANAAGVLPLGLVGSIGEVHDLAAFAAMARRSHALGLQGAFCIHPAQVPILNAAFSPSAAELARARLIVDAYDAALAAGSGAIAVGGAMIDVPIAVRARALLARAEVLASHPR